MDKQQDFLKHFLQHQDDLRAFIGSLVRDRHAADDVLQDVAVVLWRKFEEYDAARPFGAWARGVASKKIMQLFAQSKKLPVPLSPEAIQAVVGAYEEVESGAGDEREALKHCLDHLPDKSRNLVQMRYEESLKLKDIASRVASSLDAVHKALTRIREALRDCVEQKLRARP